MAIHSGSRYTKTPIFSCRGQSFIFNIRKKTKFNPDSATYYTFKREDTLDGIAYSMYGNANLYWAILDANPQYLSETDIPVGAILMIPSLDEVVSVSG